MGKASERLQLSNSLAISRGSEQRGNQHVQPRLGQRLLPWPDHLLIAYKFSTSSCRAPRVVVAAKLRLKEGPKSNGDNHAEAASPCPNTSASRTERAANILNLVSRGPQVREGLVARMLVQRQGTPPPFLTFSSPSQSPLPWVRRSSCLPSRKRRPA